MTKSSIAVIVLNWNGADLLPECIDSLLKQSAKPVIILVDNGSTDHSRQVIESYGDDIVALWNKKNKGFSGGVNTGISYALKNGCEYIALLNNDATANKDWVKYLSSALEKNKKLGGVTCSLLNKRGSHYDSTGEMFTTWGLAYPRGRGEKVLGQYNQSNSPVAVSGGASMFRAKFFKDIGLFDEDFFAYYEDVDICLRGQLRGWEFAYIPEATANHATGSTSRTVNGLVTYQTMKNLPWVVLKNVPARLLLPMLPKFLLAYAVFLASAVKKKKTRFALHGMVVSLLLLPKKFLQRFRLQHNRTLLAKEFGSLLTPSFPPGVQHLKQLRSLHWKRTGKKI